MNIIDELYSITDELNACSIEYAVCGGLAVAIHGRPRMTIDIELLAADGDESAVCGVLRKWGFNVTDATATATASGFGIQRVIRFHKDQTKESIALDVMFAHRRDLTVSVECINLDGHHLRVLTKSNLIAMKLGSEQLQDKVDAESLEDLVVDRTEELKFRSRGWSGDMTSAAIAHRLKIVAELYDLWWYLKSAKITNLPNQLTSDAPAVNKDTSIK